MVAILFTLCLFLCCSDIASFYFNGYKSVSPRSLECTKRSATGASIQSFDYTSLFLSIQELQVFMLPSKVENILQLNNDNLYIGVKTLNHGNSWLQLSWDFSMARVALSAPPKVIDTKNKYSFGLSLKSMLKDLFVVNITLPKPFERIIKIDFADKIGNNIPIKWSLITEINGGRSNVILVSGLDNIIAQVAFQVSAEKTIRPLQTGFPYSYPPKTGGVYSPLESTLCYESFTKYIQSVNTTLSRSFLSNFQGMSPNIINTMSLYARNDTLHNSLNVKDIDEAYYTRLYSIFNDWRSIFQGMKRFNTFRIYPNNNRFSSDYTMLLLPNSTTADTSREGDRLLISSYISQYYTRAQYMKEYNQLYAVCKKMLNIRYDKINKNIDVITKNIDGVNHAENITYIADLITAFAYSYDKSNKVLKCQDFTTDAVINITIPTELSATEYAQKLYKKYKKIKRSENILQELQSKAVSYVEYLDEIDASLENVLYNEESLDYDEIATLRDLFDELEELKDIPIFTGDPEELSQNNEAEKVKKKSKNKIIKKDNNNNGVSASGNSKKKLNGMLSIDIKDENNEIVPCIIGRSAKQNDRITFEFAKQHHVWLHVQGVPGAHCLLTLEPGKMATAKVLQDAANIAAFFSKARGSTQVPVVYTNPRYLKKIKGGRPGMVSILKNDGVLFGRPDDFKK